MIEKCCDLLTVKNNKHLWLFLLKLWWGAFFFFLKPKWLVSTSCFTNIYYWLTVDNSTYPTNKMVAISSLIRLLHPIVQRSVSIGHCLQIQHHSFIVKLLFKSHWLMSNAMESTFLYSVFITMYLTRKIQWLWRCPKCCVWCNSSQNDYSTVH